MFTDDHHGIIMWDAPTDAEHANAWLGLQAHRASIGRTEALTTINASAPQGWDEVQA